MKEITIVLTILCYQKGLIIWGLGIALALALGFHVGSGSRRLFVT
jgi:hypothetical protein